jgi:CRP/FNR family transcriptional regulator
MQIDIDLLFSWGAISKKYRKNDVIFDIGDTANFYFQIIEGNVKMFSTNDEGKEFTQGIFSNGESFGEPPLFINKNYPSKAIAFSDCVLIKLSKDKFLKIIDEYPKIQRSFLELLANKIYSKTKSSIDIINQKPEYRIMAFLDNFKEESNCFSSKIYIPFTRQEIANFTGLRVETVIRVMKKFNLENKLDIINHKIYY